MFSVCHFEVQSALSFQRFLLAASNGGQTICNIIFLILSYTADGQSEIVFKTVLKMTKLKMFKVIVILLNVWL